MNQVAEHVCTWIERAVAEAPDGHVPLLFLSGPQGSGKSTALSEAVRALSMPVTGASIDDFYLTHEERADLARTVSPLLATRGPPGTHDLTLLQDTVAALRAAGADAQTSVPVFDKLADDRAPASAWHTVHGRPAAIVIEGWLMGALPDAASADDPPLNAVEASDTSGRWRPYQEAALSGPYTDLWEMADGFCHIVPPDFDCVLNWRLQQEAALWAERGAPMPDERRDWVIRFIQHYERITRRMIGGGRRQGAEIHIDADRNVLRTSGC